MSFRYEVNQLVVRVTELKNGNWRMSLYAPNGTLYKQVETETSGESFRQALIWLDDYTKNHFLKSRRA